jgi:poly(U)-specific endoribonuclease
MANNIYQKIWDADQQLNGVPALLPEAPRDDTIGYAVVNEVNNGDSDTNVISKVLIPDSKRSTYDLCLGLYNNYTLNKSKRENETPEEKKEVDDFIDAIKDTAPMKLARKYIETNSGQSFTDSSWAASIREIWFRFFAVGNSPSRSGFEHVFVGEQSTSGKIGGYHFWHKYYLDDNAGLSNYADGKDNMRYNGTRYRDKEAEGVSVPEVVTLSHVWDAYDYENGTKVNNLSKSIGGFWVGCSPEGLMALGMVRFQSFSPTTAEINSAKYLLKLFGDGTSINTFYPQFDGLVARATIPPPETPVAPPTTPVTPPTTPETPSPPTSTGDVRIIAALVNPEGDDAGNETVSLINVSARSYDLKGWSIAGNNGNEFEILDATLDAGEFRTFRFPKNTAQLTNKSAKITLKNNAGDVVQVVSYAKSEIKSGITITF